MRITIECRRCQRTLHGDIPLGGSPAELVKSFGWVYVAAIEGYLCSSCAAAAGLVSTDRRSA